MTTIDDTTPAHLLGNGRPVTEDGLYVRFIVNTIAPYLLATRLKDMLGPHGRIINLSSAAQTPVDLDALVGRRPGLADMNAYAQSKQAIKQWTRVLADRWGRTGPFLLSVNPGSLLASKMVREGFGVAGNDIGIGVDILRRAALGDEFAVASGGYVDNDAKRLVMPDLDAAARGVTEAVEGLLEAKGFA